jgi:two-component system, OmpR family, copper resistance phosphate regulon response regulator CusR
LLDLGLPIKDGLTVLKELRAKGGLLPVIVVTAVTDDKSKQEVLSLGASAYVTKPFRFSDLLDTVRSSLSENQ